MKPYFETDLGKLYHGDCLDIIPGLEDVHLVNTDPLYNLNKDYGHKFKNIDSKINDNLIQESYWKWFRSVFNEIGKKLKNGYLYCSHSDKGVWEAKTAIESTGLEYIQLLIWWGKNGYSRALHTNTWGYRHETILFFRKGNPDKLETKTKGMWFQSVIEASRPQSNYKDKRYHVAQKPLKLYQTIIARTPGEITIDPFLGSGTTAIVCEKLNRRWIGIEISEECCEIAKQRIIKETRQLKFKGF